MYEDIRMIAVSTLREINDLKEKIHNLDSEKKIDKLFRGIIMRVKKYFMKHSDIENADAVKKALQKLEERVHVAIKNKEPVTGGEFNSIFDEIDIIQQEITKLRNESLEADQTGERMKFKFAI